jgi:hypothetical protein
VNHRASLGNGRRSLSIFFCIEGKAIAMTLVRVVPLNRPVKPAFDWKREFTQAELDANARYVAEQERLRAEFRQQWSPSVPMTDDPESDYYLVGANTEGAAFKCWLLQRDGYVAAATPPLWVNHVEDYWLTKFGDGVFDKQPTAASITLPFLMQGGEFSVTYESYKQHVAKFSSRSTRSPTNMSSRKSGRDSPTQRRVLPSSRHPSTRRLR